MQYLKKAGRIISILLTIVLALVLIGNIYIIVSGALTGRKQATMFGYTTAIVISGSMSGSIEVNDLVVIHKEDHYESGDVITYVSGDSLVTHRIVDQSEEGYLTKGDANNAVDANAVSEEEIVGKVVLVIPKVGIIQQYMTTPAGMISVLLICAVLILLPAMLKSERTSAGGDDDEKE